MPDILAAISRSAVTVQVAGHPVTVPYRAAGHWLTAVADSRPSLALMRLADEDGRAWLIGRLAAGDLALETAVQGSYDALSQAGGRAWWESYRLLSLGAQPAVLGHLLLAGVDPWARSLGEWCAAVHTLMTRNSKEEDVFKFDSQLAAPPAGFEDEWDDSEDFDAMVAAARNMPGMA
ncbi:MULTISPECIES: hypothetical protein [unclassified Streptomyces]|uniref:hypothetical protein n=1 Tax=unclassified Streptomyces TaxID=2593676 RepID=UPI00081EBB15|nr:MULTISPECIES: hypothetical protein [unclassified Streptomyces]MYZ38436.1 hypothetical protein [Streptomyces sp. SID4917]SCF98459.1 hypothetical protein GA0115259_106348 [Streptomyces sp. MnatMP-M17]